MKEGELIQYSIVTRSYGILFGGDHTGEHPKKARRHLERDSGRLAAFLLAPTGPFTVVPPRLYPERQQDRADDHHALNEDAEPGDLAGQSGKACLNCSEKLSTTAAV